FDQDSALESHHYAFHVSDAEFDAIFGRIKQAGLTYGSAPWSLDDGKLNDWNGGRGGYFKDPKGHVPELMTVPHGCRSAPPPPKIAPPDWASNLAPTGNNPTL